MKLPIAAIAVLCIAFVTVQAQDRLPCITHSQTDAILEHSPEKQALREQLEREYQEYLDRPVSERAGGLKVIPTVVHVIHDGGAENLSKQTILNAIEVANEELRGTNGGINSVVSAFSGIIGDTQCELRLAKVDHQGNCTDGITRTRSSLTYEAGETVKDLINWNTGSRRYLQVWLVQSVGSGAGGYTFLPGTNGAQSNGIIIRAAQFQGSLAHEFGHWLNLNHTWGPTNDPEEASNCSFDDNVSDTPNTIGTLFECNTTQESCGSLDNVQNHMDYSSCARMFTAGQAARMQAAANSSIGGRNIYWSNENRVNTGTNDGFDAPACTPEVDFVFSNSSGCEGLEVTFDDVLWGADEDPSWVWNWSFPGGTPSSSNEQNPTVVYNSSGSFDVTLTISTGQGSESHTVQDAVVVTSTGGGIAGPFMEGMENSAFPNNSDPSIAWEIETPGGLTWQRNTTAAFTGNASARINLRSITEGDVNSLISPPLDMSEIAASDATLTFRVAHANRTGTNHDERLRVYASRNCGETWTLRYQKAGDALNTAGGLVSSTFVPDENDWRLEEVSLASMSGEEHVLIKFEATSDRQSYLYIDDININQSASTGTGVEEATGVNYMSIYPNPIDGTSQLEVVMSESQNVTIAILNMLGQELSSEDRKLAVGTNRINLGQLYGSLKSGVYILQLRTETGSITQRFIRN